ncbi:MAG: hypothetical protein U0324_07355 [Polyangiales bacterium]
MRRTVALRPAPLASLALAAALFAACTDSGPAVVGGRLDATLGDTAPDEAPPDVAPDASPPDAAPDVAPDVAMDVARRCGSDMECVGDPGGRVCDVASGRCVACSPTADTCPATQHCDAASLTCVTGCRSDEGCAADPGADAGADGGAAPRNRCDTMNHVCVQCATDAHCGAGQLCMGNVCVAGCSPTQACPAGQTCCSGGCVDVQANTAHCGACGNRCSLPNATEACVAGACAVAACTAPFADCDMNPANGCEADIMTTLDHCGGCGMAAPMRAHASRNCAGGRPGYLCDQGFADCNSVEEDGCEVSLRDDVTHCGACPTLCNPTNGRPSCAMGMCGIASCNAGFADCDMNVATGCEVDTQSSAANCGRCGNACPTRPNAFPGCLAGRCVISCLAGFQDCNGDESDGCEVDIRTDTRNCGACARPCAVANATAGCAMGACTVATCNAGFADCNMRPTDGCEVNTQVEEANCGGCGMTCTVTGGTPVCRAGACQVSRCDAGREDCDMMPANGCEVNTQADVNHCGGCGARCMLANATPTCTAGACRVATCDAGFADCDGMPANGCEVDTRTSAANCGGCGMACRPANATGACVASACTVATCNPGFADCDMLPANGCEVDTRTSAANCGACGRTCATGQTCQGGFCTRFPSTGAEGAYNPTASAVLAPGVHNFTTINIPAGVVIRTTTPGVLDLRATGDVTVAGTITVGGGTGAGGGECTCGVGGDVGTSTAAGTLRGGGACAGGAGGTGGTGENGTNVGGGRGGVGGGGGAGGTWGGGGGGGGISGGVGGTGSEAQGRGGNGSGSEEGGGGTTVTVASWGMGTPPTGGTIAAACYRGGTGNELPTDDGGGGSAGGGGSIGVTASRDLDVAEATFRPGSGGGGGGGGSDGAGCDDGYSGGGGGGGGGGALRIATTGTLTVAAGGALSADGGPGGITTIATDDGAHDNGGSGGGGSGGVLFLYAPRMSVAGRVTAAGGAGGNFFYPPRSVRSIGGEGGLGRIRVSVDTATAGACALGGTFNPPLAAGCTVSATNCTTAVRTYPN